MLVTRQVSPNELSGPVGIVKSIGDTYQQSVKNDGYYYALLNMLNWTILLSANLGVMNLLPLPALDGGRLLFLIIEAIRRKRIDPDKEGMVNLVGIVLLFGLNRNRMISSNPSVSNLYFLCDMSLHHNASSLLDK